MRKIFSLISSLLTSVFLLSTAIYSQQPLSAGPEDGKLMIVGGGSIEMVFPRFLQEAGGKNARIIIVPTASGRQDLDEKEVRMDIISRFNTLGAENAAVLHTFDPLIANTPEFVKPIQNADAIWFTGGRQWRLMDAYDGTRSLEEFRKVLERGGIIGGTSAGATIQGSFLARGDTQSNLIMMGDHQEGFAFLPNTVIDQHVLVRNRQFDIFEILEAHPDLLGIGLDEKTALLISGDTAEVLGPSYVLIYDNTMWQRDVGEPYPVDPSQKPFYFLREGNKYDLRNRRIILKQDIVPGE